MASPAANEPWMFCKVASFEQVPQKSGRVYWPDAFLINMEMERDPQPRGNGAAIMEARDTCNVPRGSQIKGLLTSQSPEAGEAPLPTRKTGGGGGGCMVERQSKAAQRSGAHGRMM